MFELSGLFLFIATISGILGFGFLDGTRVDIALLVFLGSLALFSVSGMVGVYLAARSEDQAAFSPAPRSKNNA